MGHEKSKILRYEIWTATESQLSEGDSPADDLSTEAADYRTKVTFIHRGKTYLKHIFQIIDGSTVDGPQFGERNGYTARLSGYFVGPYNGTEKRGGSLKNDFSPRKCVFHSARQRQDCSLHFKQHRPSKQETYQIPP